MKACDLCQVPASCDVPGRKGALTSCPIGGSKTHPRSEQLPCAGARASALCPRPRGRKRPLVGRRRSPSEDGPGAWRRGGVGTARRNTPSPLEEQSAPRRTLRCRRRRARSIATRRRLSRDCRDAGARRAEAHASCPEPAAASGRRLGAAGSPLRGRTGSGCAGEGSGPRARAQSTPTRPEEKSAARQRTLSGRRERAKDTRRKILLGAWLMRQLERGEFSREALMRALQSYLEREDDRALFDLPPLSPGSAHSVSRDTAADSAAPSGTVAPAGRSR